MPIPNQQSVRPIPTGIPIVDRYPLPREDFEIARPRRPLPTGFMCGPPPGNGQFLPCEDGGDGDDGGENGLGEGEFGESLEALGISVTRVDPRAGKAPAGGSGTMLKSARGVVLSSRPLGAAVD